MITIDSWQDAERFAASHMAMLGAEDAKVTPAGTDGGVDVIATAAIAQVKYTSSAVGSPVVQQIAGVGSGSGRRPMLYSLAGFTTSAVRAGAATETALFSYTSAGEVEAWSPRAEELLRVGFVDLRGEYQSAALSAFSTAFRRYAAAVADVSGPLNERVADVLAVFEVDPQRAAAELGDLNSLSRMMKRYAEAGRAMTGTTIDRYDVQLKKVQTMEALQAKLAARLGIDYAELEAEAARRPSMQPDISSY